MKPVIPCFSVTLLIIIFSTFPVMAATIHVPADQPTIQAGIDVAVDGDRVLVAPGTYVENIVIEKSVTVEGESGPSVTIIDGDRAGPSVEFSTEETALAAIRGFTIRNGMSFLGGGILCTSRSAPHIANCTISKNIGIHYGGGIYCEGGSPSIRHCTVTENISSVYGGGLSCWSDSYPEVINCIFWDNYAQEGPEMWIGGMSWDTSRLTVRHSDVKGGEDGVGKSPDCEDCTIVWGEENIDVDPRFIPGSNFHLRPDSHCIDVGTDAGIYTDMDGQSRPWGTGFDMGADEFSAEPCSTIASSGNQFVVFYLLPAMALIFFSRRFLRR